MHRRALLRTVAVLPLAALAGCSIPTKAIGIGVQAVSDIGLIASGLSAALPALQASGLVTPAVLAKVQGYVTQLTAIAGSITNTSTQLQGQTAVQQMETILNAIVSALAGFNLPMPFGPALTAAAALLPIVEVAVGLAVTAVAGAPAMSARAARQTLIQAGGHV